MNVPTRIGVDLDGVLADLDAAVAEVSERLFGPGSAQPSPGDFDPERNGDAAAPEEAAASPASPPPARAREIWREIRGTENFWETLKETEAGAVARLAALADEHRWDVVFLTQRPTTAGGATQRQSQ